MFFNEKKMWWVDEWGHLGELDCSNLFFEMCLLGFYCTYSKKAWNCLLLKDGGMINLNKKVEQIHSIVFSGSVTKIMH